MRAFEPSGDLAIRPEAVGLTWPRAPRECSVKSGVAVISICGPLEHKGGGGSWWAWFDSYASILDRFEGALRSEDVKAVLLQIDSPGGEVSGLQETVRRMRKLRKESGKPVVAYADDEAYSAAYALACAADEIYLPESGGIGSVGVLATLCDRTKMTQKLGLRIEVIRSGPLKAEGHPDIPLSDATMGRVQRRVDGLARQFFRLVNEARPISMKDLAAMGGGLSYGQKAVDAGLADGVMAFSDVLAALAEDESFDNLNRRSVPSTPDDRSASGSTTEGDDEMAFAALQKKVADALAALNASKSSAERKKLATAYGKAVTALAEAKVKKSYKKKVVEEEEETDDGEAEEDEESDEEDEESTKSDDDGGDDDDDEGDDDEEEEKKMKKGKKAAAGSSLVSFVRSLTGQKSDKGAREVLASMHEAATAAQQATERVAALEAATAAAQRDALITSMVSAGQLKPSQLDWAKTQSIKSLRSYAKATPAMFAPRPAPLPGEATEASGGEVAGDDGLTATERKICEMTGVSVESYKKQRALTQGIAQLPKVN